MSTLKKDYITSEDINMDKVRERSIALSSNSSRVLLTYSNLSLVLYIDRMKVQSEDTTWTGQTKQLFYATHKEGRNNNSEKTKSNNDMSFIYVNNMNNNIANTDQSCGFKSTLLFYSNNQPTNQNS